MNEEKIGGISFDDIYKIAMDGLEDDIGRSGKDQDKDLDKDLDKDFSEKDTDKKDPSGGTPVPDNVMNKLSAQYRDMVNQVLSYLDSKRTAEALQMAQDLIDHNISSEVAWLVYAYAKEEWGDKEMAKKAYEQAIAINPNFALALNDFGVFYSKEQQNDMASYYYNRALECEPKNTLYMGNVARVLMTTDSFEAAIQRCKEFIEISEEKTYLQNILGSIYVKLCEQYIVDVPDDYEDPNCDTTPGFISLEDINDVRKYCNEAKSLLTLSEFKEDVEAAEYLLQVCDADCELIGCHRKLYRIIQTVVTGVISLFLSIVTWGIFLPFGIIATLSTYKADFFPAYMVNYAWCTGTSDPLQYSRDSFYKNHEVLKSMADGAIEGWKSGGTEDSLFLDLLTEYIKGRYWFMKARIQFYKRYIKQKKEQKQNSIGTVKIDDIQGQE